jgi:hypothetical protein
VTDGDLRGLVVFNDAMRGYAEEGQIVIGVFQWGVIMVGVVVYSAWRLFS